ncbi:TPA: hypothetical protein VD058_001074 [Streptococcus pyogenes]|nr:hypothetical protein [Streptococcus pyogenes]
MTKEYISYISATIFLLYGLLAAKWIFLGLGLILVLVGLADRLNSKNNPSIRPCPFNLAMSSPG